MLVGVVSDSHDQLDAIAQAVTYLNEKKIGFAVHAGDFVAPFSLKHLENLRCPWIGVFGNNDGDQAALTKTSQGRIQPPPFELNLDGKKVVVVHDLTHYDIKDFASRGAEIVIHGHTHQAEIRKEGKILLINPGEICGLLTGRNTVALVETKNLEATIEDLPSR